MKNLDNNGQTSELVEKFSRFDSDTQQPEPLEGFISKKGKLKQSKTETFLSIDDKILATYGSVVFIGGKSKTGKTSLLAEIMRVTLAGGGECVGMQVHVPERRNVVYIDTELPEDLHDKLILRISTNTANPNPATTDDFFNPYWLRECVDTDKVLPELDAICNELKPGLIVIDGLADLTTDTNSQGESKEIIRKIMRLGSKSNAAIICVLHENEKVTSGEGLRGALGSEAQRKCDLVLSCSKTPTPNINQIDFPVYRRCAAPPILEYTFDAIGNIQGLGIAVPTAGKKDSYSYQTLIELIFYEAKVGTLAKAELVKNLMEKADIVKQVAYRQIKKLVHSGVLSETSVGITLVTSK